MVGGLFGDRGKENSLSASTTHGMRYKRFLFGGGIGYDAYERWQTVPIFASVGVDLWQKAKNALYLQVSGGHSKAWRPEIENDAFVYDSQDGGMFTSTIGYRIAVEDWSIHFAAGYKFQRITYVQKYRWFLADQSRTVVRHDIERFAVMIGIGYH